MLLLSKSANSLRNPGMKLTTATTNTEQRTAFARRHLARKKAIESLLITA